MENALYEFITTTIRDQVLYLKNNDYEHIPPKACQDLYLDALCLS